ncbi:unnamed protein product [Didymodactylos carnosus]|uniref:Uncharacterized protein n=1 Tax=Didymodactylos carnosus TaxID=1234261 RepID=A0A814B0S1_9BILA|nr:unnamed protein product [Didymodactylos carnosus]CAF3699737.1 unnamed protein product [Didymodactylos carnosus]
MRYSNYNRRMPSLPLKLNRNSTTTPITKMPGSTSLQDIRTQKYWAKEERLIRLPESYLPIRDPLSPDNLVFEHPELTVKVSALDDELQRRMQQQQSRTGSVPNLIEHPDIRQPLQLQPVLPSTSKITRQMSADVNVQRSPSPASSITSPIHERHYSAPSKKQDDQLSLSLDQHWFQQQQLIPNNNRAISLRSNITDILEKPEHDKNDINPSTTNRDDQHQRHVEIIREYSDTSTVSDDQTNRNKPKATATTVQKSATNGKSPSDDDFW